MNTATKIVYEWLWDNYCNMSSDDDDFIDTINPKNYAQQECNSWLVCAPGYQMDDGSDEMYPPWVPLVVTPAISDTIDWPEIKTLLCKNYKIMIESWGPL